jgi:hypothetical protein
MLWSPGYFVSTVGIDEKKILKYIQWQECRIQVKRSLNFSAEGASAAGAARGNYFNDGVVIDIDFPGEGFPDSVFADSSAPALRRIVRSRFSMASENLGRNSITLL